MLQKVVVSRRMLLKGLGMGAGMVAVSGLSGCTQFLKRSESSVPVAPAGAGNARQRLAQLAREAKEAWKDVLRDYNRWRKTKDEPLKKNIPQKVQRAKQKLLSVLNDRLMLEELDKLDQRLKTVKTTLNQEQLIEDLTLELLDTEMPTEMVEAWKRSVYEADPETGRKAILEAGGFANYARKAITEFKIELASSQFMVSSIGPSPLKSKMKPLIVCYVSGAACIVLIAYLIYLQATGEGDEQHRQDVATYAAASCGTAIMSCQKKPKEEQPPQPPPGGKGGN